MKLFALPQETLNRVLNALQDLPFKTALPLINDVNQAKLVVDADQNPVELPDVTAIATTTELPEGASQAQ